MKHRAAQECHLNRSYFEAFQVERYSQRYSQRYSIVHNAQMSEHFKLVSSVNVLLHTYTLIFLLVLCKLRVVVLCYVVTAVPCT